MGDRERAIDAASQHCDLAERLLLVPPSALVRGLYFGSVQSVLDAAGRGNAYREIFPEKFAAVSWQPVSEFLKRLVVAGSLLTSPREVHEGMYEIGRRNAVAFADSLLGRTLMRLLSKDPGKLVEQAAAGRRQSYTYGRWVIENRGPQEAVVEMTEEYLYIDSYMLGAAKGTFDAINRPVDVTAELDGRFAGRHFVRW